MSDETGRLGGRAIGARASGMGHVWARLVITSVFDGWAGLRASGMRGLSTAFPRLKYAAGGYEIDVQIPPGSTAGHLRILGRVLGSDFEPCAGCVGVDGAFRVAEADLDARGPFAVDDLTASGHRLEIDLDVALIEIPMLYL